LPHYEREVEYLERIPTTPALLAPNQLNHIDPFLLLSELPARPYYHILGDARTLYNKWWKRQLLRLTKGVIPLERLWSEGIAVIESAVPIVPVAIIGTQNLYFKKELTICFGQPLIFPQCNRPKPHEVQAALMTLLPQDYREPNEVKLLSDFLNRMFW